MSQILNLNQWKACNRKFVVNFSNLRSRHEKVRIYPSGRRYVASIWARLPVVWSPDLRQCPCLILSSSVQQGCQISDSVILLSSVKQGYQSGSQTALMPPSMKLVELLLLTQSWNFCLRIDFVGTTMPEGIPVLMLCLNSFKCCRFKYFEIWNKATQIAVTIGPINRHSQVRP